MSGQPCDVIHGNRVAVRLTDLFSIEVTKTGGDVIWSSSDQFLPTITLTSGQEIPLYRAKNREVTPFKDGNYAGQRIKLQGFENTDASLEVVLALDPIVDELLIHVEELGGRNIIREVKHLYRIEKPILAGGYMVLPHGSGYLVPADCQDELPGTCETNNLIGARWTLPMFGMVAGDESICVIVDTWWDCEVEAIHIPGQLSALDLNWVGSLGKLGYARRQRIRFAKGMDYVAMAKLYRKEAKRLGLLRTLEQKAEETPIIHRYIENVLVRWPHWAPEHSNEVLADLHKIREMGFGLNFFFPKWPAVGYSPDRSTDATVANGGWQGYLHPSPVPGGWNTLACYASAVRKLGCIVQGFINPRYQDPDSPEYDEGRWPLDATGKQIKDLSTHDALDRIRRVLDNIQAKGFGLDVLYSDGFSAHIPLVEDFSPSHPVTRRETFEIQNACMAEARRRGIMPGAEIGRFWCIGDCDYFFFTDWGTDRLTNTPTQGSAGPVGEPIPLFQLVFHNCYIAGFSGGGYSLYSPGYDWWPDRTPRLYELMFASAPAYSWLPIPEADKSAASWMRIAPAQPAIQNKLVWLKRWSTYYKKIANSEMISHEFLTPDRTRQCVKFANGVLAEFDMEKGLCRVRGVKGFSGDWQVPCADLGTYAIKP